MMNIQLMSGLVVVIVLVLVTSGVFFWYRKNRQGRSVTPLPRPEWVCAFTLIFLWSLTLLLNDGLGPDQDNTMVFIPAISNILFISSIDQYKRELRLQGYIADSDVTENRS